MDLLQELLRLQVARIELERNPSLRTSQLRLIQGKINMPQGKVCFRRVFQFDGSLKFPGRLPVVIQHIREVKLPPSHLDVLCEHHSLVGARVACRSDVDLAVRRDLEDVHVLAGTDGEHAPYGVLQQLRPLRPVSKTGANR